jgi:hypothetical protein
VERLAQLGHSAAATVLLVRRLRSGVAADDGQPSSPGQGEGSASPVTSSATHNAVQ